jgi:Cu2+-exporting ATPase
MAASQGAVTKLGLLIVRGHVMEGLAKVTDIVLDKTGTLTIGEPELTEVELFRADIDRSMALAIAAGLEEGQSHPLALAFVRAAHQAGLVPNSPGILVNNQLGSGVRAGNFVLGSQVWMQSLGHMKEAMHTHSGEYGTVFLADEQGLIARFVFLDTPRAGVSELLAMAKRRSITVHMVSGDDSSTVSWWASHFGITQFHSGVSPEGKYAFIEDLQAEGRTCLAIGDGINDSAALAYADVSISFAAGSDIARETADVVLMDNDLSGLTHAIEISKQVMDIIYQNALIVGIPNFGALAVGVLFALDPLLAIIINNGSAILYASLHSQKEVVQLLLSEGSSIYDKTMFGSSCVDVTYNKEIKSILEKWPITMVIIILEDLSLNGDLLESNITDLQEYFGPIV